MSRALSNFPSTHRLLPAIAVLLAAALVLPALIWSLPSYADDSECTDWREGTVTGPSAEALVFGSITIRTGDLFDLTNDSENAFVHSAANALHPSTRVSTVFSALPFAEGAAFSEEKVAEAERILRSKRYLRDAFVTPHRICGNRVDVEIRTIDNWTLTPSVSFGSAGGQSRYSFEIQDLNVLGLGKELRLRNSHAGRERESIFTYRDDNVLGSRYQMILSLSDADGNQGYALQGGLPFFSVDADHSWWVSALEETETLKGSSAVGAEQVPALKQTTNLLEVLLSKRLRRTNVPMARLGVGLRFDREQTHDGLSDEPLDSATDHEELYPFIRAQWTQSRWVTRQNYLGIRDTEDIDLGLNMSAEAGLVLRGLGSDSDAFRLALDVSKGWYAGSAALHKFSFHQVQYFDTQDPSRSETSVRYQFFRWLTDADQLDFRLTGQMNESHSPFDNYAVGGEDGLRAYPNRFQVGDRRVLGIVEYRHVTNWSPWSLVHAAFTGFVEGGRAWSKGTDADTLANVGVGLLLSPTRSSRAAVHRFDISVPLTSNENIDDFQIFIGTQLNF